MLLFGSNQFVETLASIFMSCAAIMAVRGIESGEENHVKLYSFLKIVILIFGLTVEILLVTVDDEKLK